MQSSKKRRLLTEINVIPYVDVMLVLLVIFMVTAPFMIQGINVDLPKVDSQPIERASSDILTISINSSGKFFLEFESFKNKGLSISELEIELKKILSNNSSIEIYLRADKEVRFGEVAKLMSKLQDMKPGSINFITEPVNND
jgi:biopolymer transport protein TolR|tara:strand:+ start:141 stop:566 length:426 start_codon:yes stop_codon:yes gene_type:complete